jgi:hypothetical protein
MIRANSHVGTLALAERLRRRSVRAFVQERQILSAGVNVGQILRSFRVRAAIAAVSAKKRAAAACLRYLLAAC